MSTKKKKKKKTQPLLDNSLTLRFLKNWSACGCGFDQIVFHAASLGSIAICAIYIPPKSEHQRTLISHIVSTLDKLKTQHADLGVVVCR